MCGCILEWLKVIFNCVIGKFVMWFYFELLGCDYVGVCSGVVILDMLMGLFCFLGSLCLNVGVWLLNVLGEEKCVLSVVEEVFFVLMNFLGVFMLYYLKWLIYWRDFVSG